MKSVRESLSSKPEVLFVSHLFPAFRWHGEHEELQRVVALEKLVERWMEAERHETKGKAGKMAVM